MTTFQATVYAIFHGFTQILPVSENAHRILLAYLLDWPEPAGAFKGALSLGSLLAILIYFIHDWASMISCSLQCILFRKKPMTIDERMPIFILIAALPSVGAWFYVHETISEFEWTPLW